MNWKIVMHSYIDDFKYDGNSVGCTVYENEVILKGQNIPLKCCQPI